MIMMLWLSILLAIALYPMGVSIVRTLQWHYQTPKVMVLAPLAVEVLAPESLERKQLGSTNPSDNGYITIR